MTMEYFHFRINNKMSFFPQNNKIIQFVNCRILYKSEIIKEDLWVRDGLILNPEKVFFTEKRSASIKIDCKNLIISPGFIDLQINGELVAFNIYTVVPQTYTYLTTVRIVDILQFFILSYCVYCDIV